jgi:hypothetical protein
MKQPIQPTYKDNNGIIRFQGNEIVRYLLDNGGIDLNHLARQKGFSREDWVQFAQLIGYSVSGWSDLSYVTDQDYEAVQLMDKEGKSEWQARAESLEETLNTLKTGIVDAMAVLFEIHPDDLYVKPEKE